MSTIKFSRTTGGVKITIDSGTPFFIEGEQEITTSASTDGNYVVVRWDGFDHPFNISNSFDVGGTVVTGSQFTIKSAIDNFLTVPGDLTTITANIAANTNNIAANTNNIASNTANIASNTANIASAATSNVIGIASPSTNPGTPVSNVAYNVTGAGTYTNFNSAASTPIVVSANDGVVILRFNTVTGFWTKITSLLDLTNYLAKTSLTKKYSGKNIAEPINIVTGKYISNTGAIITSSGSAYLDFTNVLPSTQYTFSGLYKNSSTYKFLSYYTSGNVFISALGFVDIGSGISGAFTFTTPANAAKIRATLYYGTGTDNSDVSALQLELGSSATTFEAIQYKVNAIDGLSVEASFLADTTSIRGKAIVDTSNFDTAIIYGKNLFNPANILIDKYVATSSGGVLGSIAGWKAAYFLITAGQSFTISGWQSTNRAVAYVDNAGTVISYVAYAGTTNPYSGTAPIGCVRVNITIRNASEADTVFSALQIELGTNATSYVAFSQTTYVKNILNLPVKAAVLEPGTQMNGKDVATTDMIVAPASAAVKPLKVIKSGTRFYHRVPWDATYDFVSGFNLNNGTPVAFTNNTVEFINEGLIPIATTDANVPATAFSSTLKDDSDDIAPLQINGTYIGGNHGGFFVNEVTMTAHGKTVVDVGSEWLDTNLKKWYMLRVVDANTLWVISENQVAAPAWSFLLAVGGNSLTHSSGATHTGTITITGNVTTQLYPSYKNQVKKVFLDGETEITAAADGVYTCNTLDVVHTYDISDIPAIIAYVKSQVGSATQPAFDYASIADVARMTITYRVAENGSVTVFHSFRPNQNITLGYAGFVQSGVIVTPSGGTIYDYIPKTVSHVVTGNTYDFKAIQNVTVNADTHEIDKTKWEDANNPPERFVQFVKNSGGTKTYGNAVGYNQVVGIGKPSIRKLLIDSAFYFYNSRKMYPKGISSGSTNYPTSIIPANTLFDIVAFRYPINYAKYPNLTNFGWYLVGNDVYVNIDAHTTITNQFFALPLRFAGRQIEVIEKNTDFTLNSTFVSQDGINFSVANNYGTAVLRLYK